MTSRARTQLHIRTTASRKDAARAIDSFLIAIGRDPKKEPELGSTGQRVADAFLDEFTIGYHDDVEALIRDNRLSIGKAREELIVARNLSVTTTCPHHLMPALGKATIAIKPKSSLIGIGTVAKVLDSFARRLTLQETIGDEVCRALRKGIGAEWVACRLELTHTCMVARGERKTGAQIETLSTAGKISLSVVRKLLA